MSQESTLRLVGEGIVAENTVAAEVGGLLENNVLDSIGVEIH